MTTPLTSDRRTAWGSSVLLGLLAAFIAGVFVLAFTWPVATSSARGLPLAAVGDDAAVAAVEESIGEHADGVFTIERYDDRDAAVAAIRERDAYGAVVLGEAPEVLVASAANASVATNLTQMAALLQTQLSAQLAAAGQDPGAAAVTVTDVVPLSEDDPNGSGLIALSIPVVIGGLLGGVLISLLVAGIGRRLLALGVSAVVAGGIVTLIAHTWFGILPGDSWAICAALSLSAFGTSALVVGLHSAIGTPGIPLGAITTMLIGNPISAVSAPVEFLAEPWGEIGQYFIPGAGGALLRDLAYFPDADATRPWAVLGCWAALGVLLCVVGLGRKARTHAVPAKAVETA